MRVHKCLAFLDNLDKLLAIQAQLRYLTHEMCIRDSNHVLNMHGASGLIIGHGHLGLAIRSQPVHMLSLIHI